MANNPQLYNAALTAAAGGATNSRWITSQIQSDYLRERNAAIAFAEAVDAVIPLDSGLESGNVQLLQSICRAVINDRAITDQLSTANLALAIAALYNEITPILEPTPVPGGPIYNVADFGAVGDGIADDTAAINAAIAAANAVPGQIYLMSRHRVTAALSDIANNNISLIGRGQFNGGTIVRIDSNPLPAYLLTLTGQYALVKNIWFGHPHQALNTTSVCIHMMGFRGTLENLLITGFGGGVEIDRANTSKLINVQVNDIMGSFGFQAHGLAGAINHVTQYFGCLAAQGYPLALGLGRGDWATGTAYALGDVVRANGALWQCSTAGTSAGAGSGPSGLPSTDPSLVHVTPVVDGTAQWRFAMGAFAGFEHASDSHTVYYEMCGVLQGDIGLRIHNPAAADAPRFSHAWQFVADHSFSRGIQIEESAGVIWFDQPFITSIFSGIGIEIQANAVGWSFLDGEVFGSLEEGITIAGTGGGILDNMVVAAAGVPGPGNVFDMVAVANNSQNFRITNCSFGDVPGTASIARYGLSIGTGCDNFEVSDNTMIGNDTGPILNNTERARTRIVRNNIPEAARYDATNGVQLVSLGAGVQALNVNAGVHTVVITPTGAVVINEIVHADVLPTQNSGIRLRIIKEGSPTAGSVALRDSNTNLRSIWTPNSVDYVLSRFNDAVEVEQCVTALASSVRWRIINRAVISAVVSVPVPAIAGAGDLAYLDVNVGATAIGGITTADSVIANPSADLAAAGAGAGYFVGCRVSATSVIRLTFVGTLAGGNVNFTFTKTSY